MNPQNDRFNNIGDIVEIKELNHIQDVNQHIKLGWKLLDTYKTDGDSQNQTLHYCLGWPKVNEVNMNGPVAAPIESPVRNKPRGITRKSNKPRNQVYAL